MEDKQILQLLLDRDPSAIELLKQVYGAYCAKIARNILDSEQDVEECLSDTYLQVWNAIPPACPDHLGAYMAAVTRNLAFIRYRHIHAQRRGGGNIPLVLSELSDVVSNSPTPEQIVEAKELSQAINDFLAALPQWKRFLFVRRYYFAESVDTIAHNAHRTRAYVSITLTRLRRKLQTHLKERGFEI